MVVHKFSLQGPPTHLFVILLYFSATLAPDARLSLDRRIYLPCFAAIPQPARTTQVQFRCSTYSPQTFSGGLNRLLVIPEPGSHCG